MQRHCISFQFLRSRGVGRGTRSRAAPDEIVARETGFTGNAAFVICPAYVRTFGCSDIISIEHMSAESSNGSETQLIEEIHDRASGMRRCAV